MRAALIQSSGGIEVCQTYSVSCHPDRLISSVFVVARTDRTGRYCLDVDRLKFPVIMRAASIQTESMGCATAVLGQTMDAAQRTCDALGPLAAVRLALRTGRNGSGCVSPLFNFIAGKRPVESRGPEADSRQRVLLFRFVGCLPLTVRMGGRHRSMRAGVVQTPMEETAECPDAAGTCIAMGIGAVACDVGLMVRSGEAGGCRRDAR
jgi:hypothetical protein